MNFLSQNNSYFVPYNVNYMPDPLGKSTCINDSHAKFTGKYQQPPANDCHTYENNEKNINSVWTKGNFYQRKTPKQELSLNIKANEMSWTNQNNNNDVDNDVEMDELLKNAEKNSASAPFFSDAAATSPAEENETSSPSHHARRPMNAFLIFCKKHRPVVRKKYQSLENRGVTRILGEWWALLDTLDKEPYKNLAKEYKDAFFSANPDFKWYKLPAPPLRTLSTRPSYVQKEPSPLPSPTQTAPQEPEFTPGKLADESQLGKLSSLLNSNSYNKSADSECQPSFSASSTSVETHQPKTCNNNNNTDIHDKHVHLLESPPIVAKTNALPPKPLKKRIFVEHFNDNKSIARNIFNTDSSNSDISTLDNYQRVVGREQEAAPSEAGGPMNLNNVTKQELVDKVVDSMFVDKSPNSSVPASKNGLSSGKLAAKETRKSGRSCKGKLYAEFMVNGKLLKNKRDKRSLGSDSKNFEHEDLSKNERGGDLPKSNLNQIIKKLAERTHVNLEELDQNIEEKEKDVRPSCTLADAPDDSVPKNVTNKFNLDLRISELPSLNYENYLQRKRESKKRKFSKPKSKSVEPKLKQQNLSSYYTNNNNNKLVTGSKKRKNKQNITHLEKNDAHFGNNFSDLSGLATLAEIAANTEKINQA